MTVLHDVATLRRVTEKADALRMQGDLTREVFLVLVREAIPACGGQFAFLESLYNHALEDEWIEAAGQLVERRAAS